MSQFLQNLIARHQEAGTSQAVLARVQPRPKSRFETASEPKSIVQNDFADNDNLLKESHHSDAGSKLTQGLANASSILTSESNRPALDTQVTTQQSKKHPVIQTDSSDQIENLNERIESLTVQFGQKSPVLETPTNISSKQNYSMAEDQPESSFFSEPSNPQNLFVAGELNDRIQTILNSLKNQQSLVADNPEPVTQHDHSTVETEKYSENDAQQHTASISKTISRFQQPDFKKKQQTIEIRNEQRQSDQSGLLQIPQWLTEMQADLNKRLQEINAKPETEPVVNVTIGRVEVKAIQQNSSKQPKVRNKPSGVMSLDDYLKQRENRERA